MRSVSTARWVMEGQKVWHQHPQESDPGYTLGIPQPSLLRDRALGGHHRILWGRGSWGQQHEFMKRPRIHGSECHKPCCLRGC